MSDSDNESISSSSSEEIRATPIKVTKAKKPKINETVAKIIDKEKAKVSANSKRLKDARKQPKLQTPIEPEAPAPDPRDVELMDIKQALAELKVKFHTAQAPVVQSTTPEIAPKVKKPRAPKAPKEPAPAKAPKVKEVVPAQPAPPPRALTRDEVLRHILFS